MAGGDERSGGAAEQPDAAAEAAARTPVPAGAAVEVPESHEAGVPDEMRAEIEAIMARYPEKRSASIPVLFLIQRRYGWCTPEGIRQGAAVMGVTAAYLESVASFYDLFHMEPAGQHRVLVCTNISCWMRGGDELLGAFCAAAGVPALADDSGLEVDALEGAPGLYSARYAGPDTTHGDKMKQVLAALAGLPDAPRTARFRAVVVVAFPDSRELTAEGVCEGIIAETPRGAGGFGYDPVFLVEGGPLTMAELPAPQKNDISHRARAVHALRDALQRAADGYPSSAPTRQ